MPSNSENIGKLYESNLENLGQVSKALGWKSKEEQILRFQKLVSNFDFSKGAISINDFGAGFGDLLPYIIQNHGAQINQFNAYEINEKVMQVCKDNLKKDLNCKFFQSDLIQTEADYTVVSGTFNVRLDVEETAWKNSIFNTLNNIDLHSKKGFSFNLLTSYVDWQAEGLFYANPEEFFEYCMKNFSRRVSLIHDYPLYEWTICVSK